jgi:hypothetical protein
LKLAWYAEENGMSVSKGILLVGEARMKCSACGSTALVEGSLMDTNLGRLAFQPADLSNLKTMFGMGSRKIVSYGCIHCRNLQLTVEFNEKDIEKYQEFEGQQPGVLERINSGEEREAS